MVLGEWRNWYTRTTQNRVPYGLRVRFPPRPPHLILKALMKKSWLTSLGLSSLAVTIVLGLMAWTILVTFKQGVEKQQAQPSNVLGEATGCQIDFNNLQQHDSQSGLIAHALGTINGDLYTNSVEAFNESYRKGFRYFEVDLVRLRDGTVVTAHDEHEVNFGLTKKFAEITKAEFSGRKYDSKYTPLIDTQFVQLVKDYPDVCVILDTKGQHVEIIKRLAEVAHHNPFIMDRLIPHISDEANLKSIEAVYPFKATMLALYRLLNIRPYSEDEIINYIRQDNISAVMMNINADDPTLAKISNGRAPGIFDYEQFHNRLNLARIPHYVHSTSDPGQIKQFRREGVGVYSNGVFVQP